MGLRSIDQHSRMEMSGHSHITGNVVERPFGVTPALGGGIWNRGTVTMTGSSTVTGNTAETNAGGQGEGGGIYLSGGTVTLNGGTVTGNTPDNCFPDGSVPGCTG